MGKEHELEHSIRFDEKTNLVRLKVVGEFSFDDMKLLFERADEFYQGRDHRNILCDASGYTGKLLDKETRKWLAAKAEDTSFNRIALVGLHPAARMLAKIVVGILGKGDDTGFYKTEAQAMAWLTEGKA